MPETRFSREEIQALARLSPFELKDWFIRLAQETQPASRARRTPPPAPC